MMCLRARLVLLFWALGSHSPRDCQITGTTIKIGYLRLSLIGQFRLYTNRENQTFVGSGISLKAVIG